MKRIVSLLLAALTAVILASAFWRMRLYILAYGLSVLRAMTLPAGTHTVEWRFRAPGWTAVEGVTLAASLAILLGAVAALAYCFRKRTEKEK